MMRAIYKAVGLFWVFVLGHNAQGMVQIIIKNNSKKVYEYILWQKKNECNKLWPQETVTFPVHPSHRENTSESYLDFYDLSDPNIDKRKLIGHGSFILYALYQRTNDEKTYRGVLERKHPTVGALKSFDERTKQSLNFSLTISDSLEESELALVE